MSLTVAYNIAREGLTVSGAASSIVSRNLANADNRDASRKTISLVTEAGAGARIANITNAIDNALFEQVVTSTSVREQLEAMSSALSQLGTVIGDPEAGTSPPALIGALRAALQSAASAPQDEGAARAVVVAASSIVSSLKSAADTVFQVRTDANVALGNGVAKLNDLLQQFQNVNSQIVVGTFERRDVTDQIDQRNALVRDIAGLVDVRPSSRAGNDMLLFLSNGTTLFETVPREISFDTSAVPQPGQSGTTLRVDGVPIRSTDLVSGLIGGQLTIRDDIALGFGKQLDEIARGLIAATAESSQTPSSSLPDLAGLFTYSGGPTLPAPGAILNGLSSTLAVNANVDPARGGSLSRLRDGGISAPGDPNYVYNSSGAAGFSDRLLNLLARLSDNQTFAPGMGIAATSKSVLALATESAGWLENQRAAANDLLDGKKILSERAVGAWQSRIGVNVDDEMTTLIALQRSYQASTRLISSVNDMFSALFSALG